eukprot:9471196-Pyramimonas_sp.AAC.1
MPSADDRDLHLPRGVAFQGHLGRNRSTTTRGPHEASQAASEPEDFRGGEPIALGSVRGEGPRTRDPKTAKTLPAHNSTELAQPKASRVSLSQSTLGPGVFPLMTERGPLGIVNA